jgi:hypothetical protein
MCLSTETYFVEKGNFDSLVAETKSSIMLISLLVIVEHDPEPLLSIPHTGNLFL